MGKLLFGYWRIRGLGEPARMLLEYGKVDYEEKLYDAGHPPEYDQSGWYGEKFALGLDFPNLPYLIEGDVRLTESWAIYKYIAKNIDLLPSKDKEQRESDMLVGVIDDIRMSFINLCWNSEFLKLKDDVRKNQEGKLKLMENFLEGRKYILGEKLSFVDFALYETLDHHRLLFPNIFEKHRNIQAFMTRFESLENIKLYFNSGRYHKFPITSRRATWGGKEYNDL